MLDDDDDVCESMSRSGWDENMSGNHIKSKTK